MATCHVKEAEPAIETATRCINRSMFNVMVAPIEKGGDNVRERQTSVCNAVSIGRHKGKRVEIGHMQLEDSRHRNWSLMMVAEDLSNRHNLETDPWSV